jgi:hypothetical protein
MDDLHQELHGAFYEDAKPLTVARQRASELDLVAAEEQSDASEEFVEARFDADGLLEPIEAEEFIAAPLPGEHGTIQMEEKWFRLQKFKNDLEVTAVQYTDTAETRFAVNPLEPKYSKAFKHVCVHYFDVRGASAVSAFRFSEVRGSRREFLPSRSDFIVDVELCGKRALNGDPSLLKLWKSFIVADLGEHVDNIPLEQWSLLTQRVGIEFVKSKLHPLGFYFGVSQRHQPKPSASLADVLAHRRRSGPHATCV